MHCTILHMKKKLTPPQKTILQKIRNAITANPFSCQRLLADCAISGLPPTASNKKILLAAQSKAEEMGKEFMPKQKTVAAHYDDNTCRLIDGLFLFITFHRYLNQLDLHIKAQEKQDTPLPLSCAKEMLRDLEKFGYSTQESARHIAIFFQMRRAFYFISTTLPGDCPCMKALRCRLWNNIFTHDTGLYVDLLWNRMEDFSTILEGETGTGKGVAAAAIGRSGYIPFDLKTHRFKESFTRAFLEINLSQIPEQLIESELFGHTRGAFTGATADHAGIFARSSRYGAVFLDEIGELSPHIQVKLLKILQERIFTPVGGTKTQKFSGRVIAATNRDISQLRQQGKFRDDFYYRLCSDTITIPPLHTRLRENQEELCLLTVHLLERITGKKSVKLKEKVLAALNASLQTTYRWPGNIRELEQSIRRILLSGQYIPETKKQGNDQMELSQALEQERLTITDLTRRYCDQLYSRHGTYQEVARITGLDRRTVKKYLDKE
ncbi:MAG: sigma-54-dependent Fis family transcriptional regulator [Desulfobulbus sp.]|nr:MAG: sigma-54-dependent Fis family transcriptional regulator [Desulfobulbus sp.]